MDIHFNFKVRIEILILIAIVFFILASHLLCSCSKVSAMEAFEISKNINKKVMKDGLNKKEAFQIANQLMSL